MEAAQIPVSGGGPTVLVLDEPRQRIYALTRFDNSISVINTATRKEIGHVAIFNPEPASVTKGRRFLYDAARTSSHGDSVKTQTYSNLQLHGTDLFSVPPLCPL